MASQKVSALTADTTPATGDLMVTVDISDTTMSPNGTNKQVTLANLIASMAAVQATQETSTSTTLFVTPGVQQYHPSSAKFWSQVTGAGTPSLTTSYNTTSIADTGVGRMTVTIGTDFSSSNWCCQVSVFTSTTTGDEGIPNIDAKAAGTVEAGCRIVTPAFGDPNVGYDLVGYGDQ